MRTYNGRALYNVLKTSNLEAEPWMVEEYRDLPTNELFERLAPYVKEKALAQGVESFSSPEELTEHLGIEGEGYLLLFEAWRRLFPDNVSLSIFCDELDHLIDDLDEEPLQKMLAELLRILETEVDDGADPHETFKIVNSYCAHDLEEFLYNYISLKIEQDHNTYSSELIDGFAPFVSEKAWFDFLRIRLLPLDETSMPLDRLTETAQEEGDTDLLDEIAKFRLA